MDLLTLLIIGHIAFGVAMIWASLPPLWACYTEGRMQNFFGAAIIVTAISFTPIYNIYLYFTDNLSYFYHSPYDDTDDEEDAD